MPKEITRIFRLDGELDKKIKAEAERNHRTVSNQIRYILEMYFAPVYKNIEPIKLEKLKNLENPK
jgi:predicted DNA-binding protein